MVNKLKVIPIKQTILVICPICREQVVLELSATLEGERDILITQSQMNFGVVHKKCAKKVDDNKLRKKVPDYMG